MTMDRLTDNDNWWWRFYFVTDWTNCFQNFIFYLFIIFYANAQANTLELEKIEYDSLK